MLFRSCRLIGFEGDSIYVVVDKERKKLRSCNVIFSEGTYHRCYTEEHHDKAGVEFPPQTEVEEMNTWTEVNEGDTPSDTQILPGM